jgi:ribonuclease P protein component
MKTIPSRAGFLAARSKGEKALARGLVIQAVTRDSDDWRIGLTATKKIGNAVKRNRARRRMRALARDHLSPLAQNGIDYVLIARHDTATGELAGHGQRVAKSHPLSSSHHRQRHEF